jgi:hypothetical protein
LQLFLGSKYTNGSKRDGENQLIRLPMPDEDKPYGVYFSQLIRYSRACGSYQDFLDRRLLLTRKLWNQGCH